MAFSARGKTQTAMSDINITPLVDVVLVLLLIFMVTAPVLQSGIQVAVPHTRTVNQITEEHLVVTIDKDQNVYLQDKPINIHDLPTVLAANPKNEKKVVFVRADEKVPFGAFASVMSSIQQAGIENISIVTQPIRK
jgi:biopolymer transport protein ExbD/biopolymer transport protein TolR